AYEPTRLPIRVHRCHVRFHLLSSPFIVPSSPRAEMFRNSCNHWRGRARHQCLRLVEGDGEGLALVVGFAGEVEEAKGTVAVFGGDGEWGLAEDGVANVGVELAVVAGNGGEKGAGELGGLREIEREGDGAPGGFWFGEPGFFAAEQGRA